MDRASPIGMKHLVAKLAEPSVVLGASLATAAVFFALGRRRDAARFVVAVPVALAVTNALKLVVDEHRPRLFDRHPEQSFPSGHGAAAAAYLLSLVAALGKPRALPLATAAVAAVDASRVFDREHWPRDVACGNAIGVLGALAGALASGR